MTIKTKINGTQNEIEKIRARRILNANFRNVHRYGGDCVIRCYDKDLDYMFDVRVYRVSKGRVECEISCRS